MVPLKVRKVKITNTEYLRLAQTACIDSSENVQFTQKGILPNTIHGGRSRRRVTVELIPLILLL